MSPPQHPRKGISMVRLEFRNGNFRWWNPTTWWVTGDYNTEGISGVSIPTHIRHRFHKVYIFVEDNHENQILGYFNPDERAEVGRKEV